MIWGQPVMRKTLLALAAAAACSANIATADTTPTNVVLFTADDLGYEVFSLFTEGLPDLTPNMDKYAAQGVQFMHAHSNTSICMPSRSIMATGLYGISSGMMGFMNLKDQSIPTVMGTLSDNNYRTGVLGKVSHSTPDLDYQWNYVQDYRELGAGRDPELYYQFTKDFIAESKKNDQPFYLMVNSHDPHRAFHDPENPMRNGDIAKPSKLFSTDQVIVPDYLPDLPQTRLELSHYYNSVRRLDDTFGRVIEALDEKGVADDTMVIFLSDNGSAFPFAKANTYMFSSRTHFFVNWPNGDLKTGHVDDNNFISTVDIFPTILDATGIDLDNRFDGETILPLLRGEKQENRDYVYTQIDYKIGGPATPMRAVQSEKYGYIFNPWSKEGANYRNSNEGEIINAMLDSGDEYLNDRVTMFRDRVVEEFYDLEKDPASLNNLVDHPEYQDVVKEYRERLEQWMKEHNDPVLPMLAVRDNPRKLERMIAKDYPKKNALMPQAQIEKIQARQAERRANRNRKNQNK